MAERKVVRTALPVFHGRGSSVAGSYAQVDPDVYERASQQRWFLDKVTGAVYTDLKLSDGSSVREGLHRFVMGCQRGDNSTVRFKSDDRHDCRKSNLFFGDPRCMTRWKADKYFPSKVPTLLKYLEEHHPKSAVYNLASTGLFAEYSRKKIVLEVEIETSSLSALTETLTEFFVAEFGYKGTILVRRVEAEEAPEPKAPVVLEPAPSLISPVPAVIPETKPSTPAAITDVMQRVGGAFGLDFKDTSFEFCNFGLRQGNEILEFSFKRRPANVAEEKIQ